MSRGRRRAVEQSQDYSQGHTLRTGLQISDILERTQLGDAVVIDILDMDRAVAKRIVDAGASVVLNVGPSYSGRFPATGPMVLVDAGVIVIDNIGSAASFLKEGERIDVVGNDILQHGEVIAQGRRCKAENMIEEAARAELSGGVRIRAESLIADSVSLLRNSPAAFLGRADPDLSALVRGRAVVLVAGPLTKVGHSVLEQYPGAIIAVAGKGGAEAAVERDLTVGAVFARVDDAEPSAALGALKSDDDVVAIFIDQSWPLVDGSITGLLAAGAKIVAVAGADAIDEPLIELLDRPREQTASSALVRLDGGGRIVALDSLELLNQVKSSPPRWQLLLAGRQRTVFAVGVALALIVGVVLGSTILAATGSTGRQLSKAKADLTQLTAANETFKQQQSGVDSFLTGVQPSLLVNQLTGRKVVIVIAPGVDPAVGEAISGAITQAGGSATGVIQLTPKFLAQEQQASLDDVATRLSSVGASLTSAGPGVRVRTALSQTIATSVKKSVGVPNVQGQGFLNALASVGAISVTGTASTRADLVVFVVPDGGTAAEIAVLSDLGSRFAGNSVVTVIATPNEPLAGSALIKTWTAPSDQARLSVADKAISSLGRIALVQALAAGAKGRYGTFGTIEPVLSSLT